MFKNPEIHTHPLNFDVGSLFQMRLAALCLLWLPCVLSRPAEEVTNREVATSEVTVSKADPTKVKEIEPEDERLRRSPQQWAFQVIGKMQLGPVEKLLIIIYLSNIYLSINSYNSILQFNHLSLCLFIHFRVKVPVRCLFQRWP